MHTCSSLVTLIVCLDRLVTSFVPAGHLLICHNYDVAVAPVSGAGAWGEGEALMILGVDRELSEEVVQRLIREEGIWDVSVVGL